MAEWWSSVRKVAGSTHSFIHSGYLYSAPSRNLLRGALSPATVKEKCLKKLAETTYSRHVVTLGKSFTCSCLYDVMWLPVELPCI